MQHQALRALARACCTAAAVSLIGVPQGGVLWESICLWSSCCCQHTVCAVGHLLLCNQHFRTAKLTPSTFTPTTRRIDFSDKQVVKVQYRARKAKVKPDGEVTRETAAATDEHAPGGDRAWQMFAKQDYLFTMSFEARLASPDGGRCLVRIWAGVPLLELGRCET